MRLIVADTSPLYYLVSSIKSTSCRSYSRQSSSPTLSIRNSVILPHRRPFASRPSILQPGWRSCL